MIGNLLKGGEHALARAFLLVYLLLGLTFAGAMLYSAQKNWHRGKTCFQVAGGDEQCFEDRPACEEARSLATPASGPVPSRCGVK